MTEGPFKNTFDADTTGVVRREIVTYRIKDGMMVKESATRDYYENDNIAVLIVIDYYENGDYHDSQTSTPLVNR